MENFGLDQTINGMDMPRYMAHLLECNEKNEMDIARVKQSNATLKTMVSYSNTARNVAVIELNRRKLDLLERTIALKEKEYNTNTPQNALQDITLKQLSEAAVKMT